MGFPDRSDARAFQHLSRDERRSIDRAWRLAQAKARILNNTISGWWVHFRNSQNPATIHPVIPSEVEESAFILLPSGQQQILDAARGDGEK
jgi:hypothetical protein